MGDFYDPNGHNHHGGGHRVPDGETDYLTKAAEQLDKVAQRYDRHGPSTEMQLRLARQYALLGAIQRGVLPQEMAKELFDSVTKGSR